MRTDGVLEAEIYIYIYVAILRHVPTRQRLRYIGCADLLRFLPSVMPYTFLIDNKDCVIREIWTGIFDLDQLKDSCYAEWAHPDYRKGLSILSDLRQSRGKVSVEDVLKFASWFSNDEAPPRHAIVVRRERAFDFAGMFSMIRACDNENASQTRLFFSYAEAEAWVTGCRLTASAQQWKERSASRMAASEG